MRDEHLNGQLFDNLFEAQVLTGDWRIDYNEERPHSALGWKTPAEVREGLEHRSPTITRIAVRYLGNRAQRHCVGAFPSG